MRMRMVQHLMLRRIMKTVVHFLSPHASAPGCILFG